MHKIIDKFKIGFKNNLYNLNDITNILVKSKSPISYMDKIKNKKRIDNNFYITEDQFLDILKSSRSIVCKSAIKLLNEDNISTETIIDLNNDKFLFEGRNITLIRTKDDIWFKGKDIASILEYVNCDQSIKEHIYNDDKLSYENLLTLCPLEKIGPQVRNDPSKYENNIKVSNIITSNLHLDKKTIFINESGLYSLIMKSKMTKAEQFQRWVVKEVLPSIRKHGSYQVNQKEDNEPKLLQDLNNYDNKSCLYLIHIKDNIYKYGITDDIFRRLTEHTKDLKYDDVEKVYELNNKSESTNLENKITRLIKQMKIHCYYDKINEEITTDSKGAGKEFFAVNNKYTIDVVKKYIEDYKDNIDEDDNELEIQKEITKQKDLSVKEKELSVKEKQIEFLQNYKGPYLDQIVCNLFKIEYKNTNNNDTIQNDLNLITDDIINTTQNHQPNVVEELIDDDSDIDSDNSESEDESVIEINNKCLDCNISIAEKSTRCNKCENKHRFLTNKKGKRPPHEQLLKDLETMSYVKVGQKYGVSDNGIRRWLKTYDKYEEN